MSFIKTLAHWPLHFLPTNPLFVCSPPSYSAQVTWSNMSTTLLPRSSFPLPVDQISTQPPITPPSLDPPICLSPASPEVLHLSSFREKAENVSDLHYNLFMMSPVSWVFSVAATLLCFPCQIFFPFSTSTT